MTPEALEQLRKRLAGNSTMPIVPEPAPTSTILFGGAIPIKVVETKGSVVITNLQATGTTTPTPLTNAEQIMNRISDLQQSLASGSPGYESILHVIHRALLKDEEAVHLLTEDQIGIICSALGKKTNTVIAEVAVKRNKTTGGKALKDISLEDI